jgi:hypothetical protein
MIQSGDPVGEEATAAELPVQRPADVRGEPLALLPRVAMGLKVAGNALERHAVTVVRHAGLVWPVHSVRRDRDFGCRGLGGDRVPGELSDDPGRRN